MNRLSIIASGELRLMLRSRLALIGLLTLVLLSAIAAATSWVQMEAARTARSANQIAADEQFDAQPARHPHRMVHYGSYALRPVGPLAAFDPGVDAFTGTVLYLEGHRQNSATFGAASESSGLIRFGQLTPAFVLQTLAPLLLVFLGFGVIARERESGALRAHRAHGARALEIVGGKALALGAVAAVAVAPALLALGLAAGAHPGEAGTAALVAFAYVLYLTAWVLVIAAGSALARTSQGALVGLIACWAIAVILVPRAAAAGVGLADPLPTRAETDLVIQADLRKLGDSHNPDDAYFAAFKARLLKQYGVTRPEDLPFNYRGALSAEGEKLTSGLFRDYAARDARIQLAQVDRLQALGLLGPAIAVRRASMVGASTDLGTHLAFLAQAEAHRYAMVQGLNRLHATAVTGADDAARGKDVAAEQRSRIAPANWAGIPDFAFRTRPPGARASAMLPSLLVLAAWTLAALCLLLFAARRLAKSEA